MCKCGKFRGELVWNIFGELNSVAEKDLQNKLSSSQLHNVQSLSFSSNFVQPDENVSKKEENKCPAIHFSPNGFFLCY